MDEKECLNNKIPLLFTSIKYCLSFSSLLRSFSKDHKLDFCGVLEVFAIAWLNMAGCKKYTRLEYISKYLCFMYFQN